MTGRSVMRSRVSRSTLEQGRRVIMVHLFRYPDWNGMLQVSEFRTPSFQVPQEKATVLSVNGRWQFQSIGRAYQQGRARERALSPSQTPTRGVCRDYNSGTCNRGAGACKFAHTCSRCGGQHAAIACESKRQ